MMTRKISNALFWACNEKHFHFDFPVHQCFFVWSHALNDKDWFIAQTISIGEGLAEGATGPLIWGINLVHSGNFPERTIGTSGNFSDCSPNRLTQSGRNLQPLTFEALQRLWHRPMFLENRRTVLSYWKTQIFFHQSRKVLGIWNKLLRILCTHRRNGDGKDSCMVLFLNIVSPCSCMWHLFPQTLHIKLRSPLGKQVKLKSNPPL